MGTLVREADLIAIARIVRPQGRHGEVIAELLTDFPEKFAERRKLWLCPRETTAGAREAHLLEHWFHKGRVVLKFAGVDSISDAGLLSSMLVCIPRSDRAALDSGAVYVSDLQGSRLFDLSSGTAQKIGTVAEVQQGPGAAPLLLVKGAQGQYDIPFAQEYLLRVDVEQKLIEMNLPPGMLDVNAPLTQEEKQERRNTAS